MPVLTWVVLAVMAVGLVSFLVSQVRGAVGAARAKRRQLAEQARGVAHLGWRWSQPEPWLAEHAARLYRRAKPLSMATGVYRGQRIWVLDLEWKDNSGESTVTVLAHLVAMELPSALPPVVLTGQRRRKFSSAANRHLELESGAFNDRFRVACLDQRYASAVVHPQVMELMLADDWLDWMIAGNALFSWGGGRWQPAKTLERLDLLCRLAGLIPNFVLRDYGRPVT